MKKDNAAVIVDDIHKEFILPQSKNSTFKQTVVNIVKKNDKVTQKTLDGVSFTIEKGDFFGIVGRNGSGKSTLLKIISGVYTPTAGNVSINGGLTPFIELGVGFNPELSGRDNVYLNGALLGYTRTQMSAMYDEIVKFAELEQFMEQKLKNYSSGMQVRLAFSIAIKAKNDILIFDEVLAVGDEAFQRKCVDVFEEYKANGQTVILVTHDMKTVKQFCNRAALISEGKVNRIGSPSEIADAYSRQNQLVVDESLARRSSSGKINVSITNGDKATNTFSVGSPIHVDISWKPYSKDVDVVMVDLYKKTGEHITTFKSNNDRKFAGHAMNKKQAVTLNTILPLMPGGYQLDVHLVREKDDAKIVSEYGVQEFIITDNFDRMDDAWSGLIALEHSWK